MFRKLKIRLIMINVASLSLVLFIIFSALYFGIKYGINQRSYMLMNDIAKEERMMPPMGEPYADRVLSGIFFIKVDTSGKIIGYSQGLNISEKDVEELKKIVLQKGIDSGKVENNNYSLKFLKVSKEYGFIVVFLDNNIDKYILKWVIIAYIYIGAISLTLVFSISLFLASKAIKPVKTSWEKLNAFVADASHELRTPLAVVTSNLEIVMENETETVSSQKKWLVNIQSELERINKLIADLLFLARSDAEDEKMPKEPFDLSGLLYKIRDSFMPLAQKKGLKLILHNKDNVTVFGNEVRIKQLITILLDNAIKYTGSGGRIELKLEAGTSAVQLSIKDTGEGIPREHIGRIFDRFYRVDKSRSRNYGGSGLGLAIAKRIVDEHKGNINVASEVGKGTEFTVVLPVGGGVSKALKNRII